MSVNRCREERMAAKHLSTPAWRDFSKGPPIGLIWGTSATIPYKKGHCPGTGELIEHNKVFNRQLSKHRASVERGNSHLKNWKILSESYRGVFHELSPVIRLVARLKFFQSNAVGTRY